MSNARPKICLAASAGGHLTQLLKLAESWDSFDAVYVSTSQIVTSKLSKAGKTYIIDECNRAHIIKSFKVLITCLSIASNERPDYVLSTGAEPGFLMCIAAKFFGARVIWVDSIANVKRLSLSGRLIRPFTDLFLTQWPELSNPTKRIEYCGGVI